jgi:aminoglycoside 6'-N-acetyltransferase
MAEVPPITQRSPGGVTQPKAIGFRPVTPADRERLATWLARPHVARWWGEAEAEAAAIVGQIGTPGFGPFVFIVDGREAGYIQWWQPDGAWEIPVPAPSETTRGIDMAIAEPGDCGRGLGPRVLRAFVERLAAEGIRRFLIDPAPENARARAAFARAGFRAVAEGEHCEGRYVLMVLDVDGVDAGSGAPLAPPPRAPT